MRVGTRAAALALLAMTSAGCWPVSGGTPDNTNHNPFESTITAANVDGLVQKWAYTSPTAVTPPVVSTGGVHVLHDCAVTTLTPGTGATRWTAGVGVDGLEDCDEALPGAQVAAGPPFVFTPTGGDVVSVGNSWQATNPLAEGATTAVVDAASGALEGVDGSGMLIAARPDRSVYFRQAAVGPGLSRTSLTVTSPGTSRAIDLGLVATGTGLAVPSVTAGTTRALHAGSGPLATAPGDPARGYGLRAYSYDNNLDGCAPTTPAGTTYTFDCPLWANPLDGSAPLGRPVIGPDGTAYVRTEAGGLFAVDTSGAVTWSAHVGAGPTPALANGRLYVPVGGEVQVFLPASCSTPCAPAWSHDTGETQAYSPTVAGDVLYVTTGGDVFAFDTDGCGTGRCDALWSQPIDDGGFAAPVVTGGRVYVTTGDAVTAYGLP
jgi:hypothetical protein